MRSIAGPIRMRGRARTPAWRTLRTWLTQCSTETVAQRQHKEDVPAQRHQMLPLATGLAAVRALAHLVWVATGQQRGAQALGIGRLLPWRSTLQRVPVLGNDLREDTPVPRGCRNHRMAPRWGDTIVMVQRLSHASAASLSTPHLVNIRLTRFDKVGRLYRTIIAAQVIRSCALARRDVGSTPSSKRSTPHSCRLTGAMPTRPSV